MVAIIKQKQPRVPINILITGTYKHGGCMITIGKISKKLQSFFRPVKRQVSEHVYSYFWSAGFVQQEKQPFVTVVSLSHGLRCCMSKKNMPAN